MRGALYQAVDACLIKSAEHSQKTIWVASQPGIPTASGQALDRTGERRVRSGHGRAAGVTTVYVHDAFGDLAAEYASGSMPAPPCATCYLSWDHLGSTRLVTDGSGNVVARHDYLPFGEEILSGLGGRGTQYGATDNVTQRFTGQERDSESGLDYFGARYFSAAQGRFISPDWSEPPHPVPYADLTDPQTLNLYSYVRNNPLSKADPDGHCGFGDPAGCTVEQWVASIPDRFVGGLKFEANAALEMVGIAPKFQPSNAEQADAMAAGEQIKPEFQQGLAMAIPGPKLEAAEVEGAIAGEPIKPIQKSILKPAKYTQVERVGLVLLSRILRRATNDISRMPTGLVPHSWINPHQMQVPLEDGSSSLSKPTAERSRKVGLRAMSSMV